jgi:hypothetical protein
MQTITFILFFSLLIKRNCYQMMEFMKLMNIFFVHIFFFRDTIQHLSRFLLTSIVCLIKDSLALSIQYTVREDLPFTFQSELIEQEALHFILHL